MRGFRATVAELGGDADRFAHRAGLPPGALDRDEVLVDEHAVGLALYHAARVLDCPEIGLRLADRQELSILGPLALAMRNAADVGGALNYAARYLFVHSPATSVSLGDDTEGDPAVVSLRYDIAVDTSVSAQAIDLGIGFVHRAVESLIGGRYGLLSVDLPHRPAAIGVYERFFGAPVRVECDAALLRFPREMLARPVVGAVEGLRVRAMTFLAEQAGSGRDADHASQVRAALRRSLGTTSVEITAIAAQLGVPPRTLQRRLAGEGTSFATILDEVRREYVHHYLTRTRMSMSRIADAVGLARQSALTRCCRRWWDSSPREIRERANPAHRDE
nr:AraC family transcriptional regulator [Nocardia bovistercoris]